MSRILPTPLPPVEVRRLESEPVAFRTPEQQRDAAVRNVEIDGKAVLAAELFDEALREAHIETAEVAYLFGVSESLVHKMRSKNARGCPSLVQMLLLPPAFHLEMHRALNRRYGFGRLALARLMEAAGELALVLE